MLLGLECSWNICCLRSDQQVQLGIVRTRSPPGAGQGQVLVYISGGESALLKPNRTANVIQDRAELKTGSSSPPPQDDLEACHRQEAERLSVF